MRISAIRGRNLASLAGDFELLLDQDPLGQVGLFAITGPTGAGKSTLLDCICLALYDQIPRLQVASRNSRVRASLDEDAEALTATDPRLCLRRGTGEGFAEVEFHDAAGVRYRSRWSVRRARNKPEGRVQNTEMSLWAADGSTLAGGGKREVLAAIEERVGLGFEQFLRSAMLAQGAFAAFLHAAPNDRATVLERVTGTEVYRLISQAAFERFRAEQAKLQAIALRLAEVGVLTDEARDALVDDQERLVKEAEERDQAVLQASHALSWHKRDGELEQAVAGAAEALTQAIAEREGLGSVRDELARAEALEPLRPHVEAVARGRKAVTEAKTLRETAQSAGAVAQQQAETSQRAVSEARKAEADLRVQWSQQQAEIEAARGLDASLEAATAEHDRLTAVAVQAERDLVPLRQAVSQAREQLQVVQAAAERARTWFEAHPSAEGRSRVVDALTRDLERLGRTLEALTEARGEHAGLAQRTEAAQEEAKALQEAMRTAEQARVEAARELRAATEVVQALDLEGIEEQGQALTAQRTWLGQLAEPARQAVEAQKVATEAASTLSASGARTQILSGEISAIEADEPLEAIRLEEAQRTLDRFTQAIGLEARRHALVDGEPCPLCGSEAHPWSEHGAPTSSLVDDQRTRVRQLHQAQLERTKSLAAKQAELGQLRHQSERAREQQSLAAAGLESAQARWSELAMSAVLPNLVSEPDPAWVRDRLAEVEQRSQALSAQRTQAMDAQRRLSRARLAGDEAQSAERKKSVAFQENRVLRERLISRAQTAQSRVESLEAERDRLVADLSSLDGLGGFPDAPVADLQSALLAEVHQAREHRAALDAEREALANAPVRAQQARLEQADQRSSEAGQARDQARDRIEGIQRERASLLQGRAVSLVLQAHATQERAARERVDAAADQARIHGEASSAAKARLEQAELEVQRCERAAIADDEALRRACRDAGVSLEQVSQGLAASPDRLRDLRHQIEVVGLRLSRAQTVRAERDRALAAHREGHTPPPRELIEAHLGQLEAAKRAAQTERATVDAQLAGDAVARSRAASLADEHAAQAAILDTWSRLSQLIGSRDGRTFKRFAQSLTLDALLSHANRHLDDLAPRYRMVRVPGSELDLQVVDRHMGDEIRGVHTLSGGESFLASLALALGLASLASTDTPVETLFIDEGFGTLDRETLDVALAALDALRATGRQVGIISHVSGLAERIGTQVRVVPTGAGRSKVVVERG